MDNKASYIGDGVYANFDGEYIWLLVGSHDQPTDKVALDISVYGALVLFAERSGWVIPPKRQETE